VSLPRKSASTHVARDRLGLGFRQARGGQSARHERAELCCRDAGFICRHFLGPCALIHFQSMPNRGQSHYAEVTSGADLTFATHLAANS